MRGECKIILAMILDYIDEKLEPREQALIASHAEVCDVCRREIERSRLLMAHLRGLAEEGSPADLWPGVAHRIAAGRTDSGLLRRLAALGWRAVLAPAAVAAVAAVFFALQPSQPPADPQRASAEYRAYMQAYTRFRSAQPLSDSAAIAAASQLQRQEVTAQ